MNITIPDGEYCNDGKIVCPLWLYGGSGSLLPFCKYFAKHPLPERHQFPFMSSIKLTECKALNREMKHTCKEFQGVEWGTYPIYYFCGIKL